ncbi:tumor necrosis factor receptor superfamily member 6 [Halichoeres trimaculatus]|uniref:tumor necrosis factor receptor superfamily member 6 n=1 Tax=Halichoeres trimaculatus TaxID=147232 RepID=UPI003D9EFEDD
MQSHYHLAFTFMCSLSFLSAVLSIQCNESQYAWPRPTPEFCCNRCQPGKHMLTRCQSNCETKCAPCPNGRYMDSFNVQLSCEFCRKCEESNMEYESRCDSIHNAVCKCKAGYRCRDQSCAECVQISTTTTDALPSPPATTVSSTLPQTHSPTKLQPSTEAPVSDFLYASTVWLLAIVVLLCAVVALFIFTKIPTLQRWIRHKLGGILDQKPAPVSTSSEDEEVSKPIQEVCGKCDQLLDV